MDTFSRLMWVGHHIITCFPRVMTKYTSMYNLSVLLVYDASTMLQHLLVRLAPWASCKLGIQEEKEVELVVML